MNGFKKFTLRTLCSVVSLGIFAVPGAISVASAQDDDESDGERRLEEIIVTSRKREESLFEIPVSVTAFSATEIENAGLEELPDLVSHTPGFHYAENSVGRGGRYNRRLIFRGMNPRTDRQTRQAATVFIDGAPTIGSEIHLPFGGTKDTGNGHRESGTAAIEQFTETKTVFLDYSGTLQRAHIDEPS